MCHAIVGESIIEVYAINSVNSGVNSQQPVYNLR